MSLDLEPEIDTYLLLPAALSAAETRLLDQAHPLSFRVFDDLLRRMQLPLVLNAAGPPTLRRSAFNAYMQMRDLTMRCHLRAPMWFWWNMPADHHI